MAGWGCYLLSLAALIALKIVSSLPLPLMGLVVHQLERTIEIWADLDFKFQRRYFDWTNVLELARALTADRGRRAYKRGTAPDIRLSFMDLTPCQLFDFVRPYRPLVINLISELREPYWTELKKFNDLVKTMSWTVDFVTVVVGCGMAASKSDWQCLMNLDPVNCIHHSCCLQDRNMLAAFLVDAGVAGHLVVDTYNNDALRVYSPIPARLYVLYRHSVYYDSGRGGRHGGYHMDDVKRYLWSLYRKRVHRDQKHQDVFYKPSILRPDTAEVAHSTAEDQQHTHTILTKAMESVTLSGGLDLPSWAREGCRTFSPKSSTTAWISSKIPLRKVSMTSLKDGVTAKYSKISILMDNKLVNRISRTIRKSTASNDVSPKVSNTSIKANTIASKVRRLSEKFTKNLPFKNEETK